MVRVTSNGNLAKYHPEHLGTFKLMKNEKYVYKSVTEKNSYLYLLRLQNKGKFQLNFDLEDLNYKLSDIKLVHLIQA